MSLMDSFEQFEQKFGPGNRYAPVPAVVLEELRKHQFPDFYLQYLERNGFKEFLDGFWWFTNPLELHEELAAFAGSSIVFPIIRNAFGCFLVRRDNTYYHLNVHTKNLALLGPHLALILNMTYTDDYALRDMFFFELFKPALNEVGRIAEDEMYAFAPALAMGGTVSAEGLHKVRLREHLAFLAAL